MNNAMFGKCLENIRSSTDIQLAKNSDQTQKLIKKPSFKCFKISSDNQIACHMENIKVMIDWQAYLCWNGHSRYEKVFNV